MSQKFRSVFVSFLLLPAFAGLVHADEVLFPFVPLASVMFLLAAKVRQGTRMLFSFSFLVFLAFLAANQRFAYSGDKGDQSGPAVQIEVLDGGVVFGEASILVDAAPQTVLRVISDYNNLKEFVPYVTYSEVVGRNGDKITVAMEHDVPLIGKFDCRTVYDRRVVGSRTEVRYSHQVCYADQHDGRVVIEPVSGGNRTRVTGSIRMRKDISLIPQFVVRIFVRYSLKKEISAMLLSIRNKAEKST